MKTKQSIRNMFIGVICGFFLTFTGVSIAFTAEKAASGEKGIAGGETAVQKVAKVKPVPDEKIRDLQEALNKAGFKVKVDGLTGKKTRAALKKFQKKNGLNVTGKPDEATLAKLGIK